MNAITARKFPRMNVESKNITMVNFTLGLLLLGSLDASAKVLTIRVGAGTHTFTGSSYGFISRETVTRFEFPTELLIYNEYIGTSYHVKYSTVASAPHIWTDLDGYPSKNDMKAVIDTRILSMAGASIDDRTYTHTQEIKVGENITIPNPSMTKEWTIDFVRHGSFSVEHESHPEDYTVSSTNKGRYAWHISNEYAEFHINATNDLGILAVEVWLDNVDPSSSAVNTAVRKLKELLNIHAVPTSQKINIRRVPALGRRASINTLGNTIHTASPGIIVYEWALPDEDTLNIPIVFMENTENATVDVYFEDNPIGSFLGSDFETNVMEILTTDISSYRGSNGLLKVELNVPGTDSAVVYIPDSIQLEAKAVTPVNHDSFSATEGEFSFTPLPAMLYSLHRSTNLFEGSSVLETALDNGDNIVMSYNDSTSTATSAFFWIGETSLFYAPEEIGSGVSIALVDSNSVTQQTFTFSDGNTFTNTTLEDGTFIGTFSYAYSNGVKSAVMTDYPPATNAASTYFLSWTNSTGGYLTSVGEETIITNENYTFIHTGTE